jgi:uncharacterized protein DUF6056
VTRSSWFAVAIALTLAPYVVLAIYAHPTADDLTYAVDTMRDGYWTSIRDQYLHWNGRFASNFLELGGPMVWGSLTLYRTNALAMIVATALASYAVVRAIAGAAWSRDQTATAAIVLTALDLHGLPALGENIYWYTGSVTYQLSAILLLCLIALLVRAARGAPTLAVAVALAVIVVGMNEVAMCVVLVGSVGWFIASRGQRRVRSASTALIVIAVAAAAAAVVLAPGNGQRASLYPARHNLVKAVLMTAAQTMRFSAQWSADGPLLLASLLYLSWGADVAAMPSFRRITRAGALAIATATFAIIAIAVFPPYWATGLLGQHRTVSVAYLVFLVLWFVTLTALMAVRWLPAVHLPIAPAIAALLVAALVATGNGYSAAGDLVYRRAQRFDADMTARYAALDICAERAAAACAIAPLSSAPDSFFVLDIARDPSDWVNAAYAVYFHTARVVMSESP